MKTNVIRLQYINGTLYPTDGVSRKLLGEESIPPKMQACIFPKMVAKGYMFAISNYPVDYSYELRRDFRRFRG